MEKLPDYDQKIDRLSDFLLQFFLQQRVRPIGEPFSFVKNSGFADIILTLMVFEEVAYFWDTFGITADPDDVFVAPTRVYHVIVDVASATFSKSEKAIWNAHAAELLHLDEDQINTLKNHLLEWFADAGVWCRVSPSDAE